MTQEVEPDSNISVVDNLDELLIWELYRAILTLLDPPKTPLCTPKIDYYWILVLDNGFCVALYSIGIISSHSNMFIENMVDFLVFWGLLGAPGAP